MANMLTINLTLDLDYRSRDPTLILLAAQTMSGKPQQYQYNYKLAQISLSQYQTTVTGVVTRENTYLNIGISLPDFNARQPPECVTIARATVYYHKCPSRKANMAIFPDVIAPSGDIANREKGQCMPNTVPIGSSGVWMYCDKTGSVDKIHGCECRAGFERASNSCTGNTARYCKSQILSQFSPLLVLLFALLNTSNFTLDSGVYRLARRRCDTPKEQ